MKNSYMVNIDEVYDVLTDNINQLPKNLRAEFSNICLPINVDIAYIIADLVRDRRNNKSWELRKSKQDEVFMVMDSPAKELKRSVFPLLNNSGKICKLALEYDSYSVI